MLKNNYLSKDMGTDSYEYKGEYLNGQKHGKGKYYKNGKLIYEGEYVNGKRHGKGKEYNYSNNKLEFEGEYLNGKRWNGKANDYYSDGKLEFEGEYVNGEKNGKAKEYYWDGKLKYDGEFVNGKKHGRVKEYYADGKLKYEGEFVNGEKHGKVKEYYSNGKLEYEGEYLNGSKHGKVKEYYSNGQLKYEGEYLKCVKHGNVREYYSDGKLKYEGEYFNGKKHGKVKELCFNGKLVFEGDYLKGEIWNGKKNEYDSGKLLCESEYLNGKKHGKYKEYHSDGKLKYECEYVNGKKNGKTREYYSNGKLKYEGEYLNDLKHGKVKEYSSDGKLIYEGEYVNGKINLKYYFIVLNNRFKTILAQKFNKKEKKISFEFEIRGTKENLNGVNFEISTFDKTEYTEFMCINLDDINNGLYLTALNLEIKEEKYIPKVEEFFLYSFKTFKSFFSENNFPFELNFKTNGKKNLIGIVCNDGEFARVLLDLGNNINENIKFNFILKSGIDLNEISAHNYEIEISRIFALFFSLKCETYDVKYFFEAIFKALKDVEIGNIKIFQKILSYLDIINLSLGSKIKFEYDAKVLAETFGIKSTSICAPNPLENGYYFVVAILLNWIIITMKNYGIKEAINLDDIKIILGDPRYKNGYVISIKIPGLLELWKLIFNK